MTLVVDPAIVFDFSTVAVQFVLFISVDTTEFVLAEVDGTELFADAASLLSLESNQVTGS